MSFYEISGIRYSVVDSAYNVVYASGERTEFCELINASPEGHARCVASDARAARLVTPKSRMHCYRCHAGALEVVLPIVDEGQIVAYLFFGQMLDLKEDMESQWQSAKEGLDWYSNPNSLKVPFSHLVQLDEKTIKSWGTILQACTSYIWLEGVVKTASLSNIQRINAYIEAHYTSQITLDEMADALSISKTKLCAVARKQQTTITHMVNGRRVEAAKTYLESTDHSIAEIAGMVGVSDYNYFTKLFKSQEGITPRQYRSLVNTKKA